MFNSLLMFALLTHSTKTSPAITSTKGQGRSYSM